jgi:hydrogenase expression/formation protein HypC
MCLAIPGKIIKVKGRQATIQYPGEIRKALIAEEKIKVGDWAMVQMGIVVSKMSQKQAHDSLKAWIK